MATECDLMDAVGRVVPVVPVALIAQAFIADPERALSELDLKAAAERELERLQARGAFLRTMQTP
jgi:hypothetical protein